MSSQTTPETFDQFYARISANRKAEILACADPVKRAELKAADERFEAQMKASWQLVRAREAAFQSAVPEEEWEERRREYPSGQELPRDPNDQHRTYRVINGRAS